MPNNTWIPSKCANLVVGPTRWSSIGVISDIGLKNSERILQIGIIERIILDRVDGKNSISDIRKKISESGIQISDERILKVLTKLAFFGAINRPFTIDEGLQDVDKQATQSPRALPDQITIQTSYRLLSMWSQMSWLAHPVALLCLLFLGILSFISLLLSVPTALKTLTNCTWPQIIAGITFSLLWLAFTTIMHENSHAAFFHAYTKREPYLALSRLGIFIMPNTHMPGSHLMSTKQRFKTLIAGPLTSMVLAAAPVIFLLTTEIPLIKAIAATCIVLDSTLICLMFSPFPNTDGTRIIETIASVDQLHYVSYLFYSRRNHLRLPSGLPTPTRLVVQVTPALLLLAILFWSIIVIWAIRLIFHSGL